eukprot:gb/GECG01010505.1/.p1 GENE.gb/GECG01010505.1/~~gb/GECG01010505.1/.p1  ORF type:complete len:132 (+),score=14.08 gb/GECG01010505.1/:1-396(+)
MYDQQCDATQGAEISSCLNCPTLTLSFGVLQRFDDNFAERRFLEQFEPIAAAVGLSAGIVHISSSAAQRAQPHLSDERKGDTMSTSMLHRFRTPSHTSNTSNINFKKFIKGVSIRSWSCSSSSLSQHALNI